MISVIASCGVSTTKVARTTPDQGLRTDVRGPPVWPGLYERATNRALPEIVTGPAEVHTTMRLRHPLTDDDGYLYLRYTRDGSARSDAAQ